jgi:serine/threonine protein kinase/Tfp pilus assembly protein PilF
VPACLTTADFERLKHGALDGDALEDLRAHLDSCDACRAAYDRYCGEAAACRGSTSPPADPDGPALTATASPSSPGGKVARHLPSIEGYRITGVLGQGGMGIVYQAVQTKLNRTVALKVLPAIMSTANPSAVSRFRREATAAARLHHTHIIPIYDFGESLDGYYYAMELISGQPLDVLVRRLAEQDASSASPVRLAEIMSSLDVPTLPEAVGQAGSDSGRVDAGSSSTFSGRGRLYYQHVARWIADAADALHYAHGQGIIHRDIKPSNLILSVDGRIMVADFGLAKTAEDKSVTMTGSFLGTLRYVSPEQAMAKRVRVDHRTDIYSLGATLYELLCFQPAYPGTDDKEILGAIIARDPTPPRKVHHPVPPELDTICLKCMEKSPDARYDSARSLAEDLRRYTHDLPIAAKRPGVFRRTAKFVKRRRASVIAVTAVVLLAAAATFLVLARSSLRGARVRALTESAMTYALTGNWGLAQSELDEALRMHPDNTQTLLTLIWTKLEFFKADPARAGRKTLEEAERLCRRVCRFAPDHPQALAYQGVALRRLDRYDEAIKASEAAIAVFEQTAELEPLEYASWCNLGAVHAIAKQLDEAKRCLLKGAQLAGVEDETPWRGAAWRNLASLELHLREIQAVDHVANAIKCHGDDVQAWLIRARLGLELEDCIDRHEALNDANHADRLAEFKNPHVKRILALAYLHNDDVDHAIRHARLALELGDMPTVNHLILASAEAMRSNPVAARDHLRAALAEWPDDLESPGDFRATAETGDLWIESADQLLCLRHEVESVLARDMP